MGARLFGLIYPENGRPLATKFLHVLYLPLIPLGTFEFLDEREGITNPTRFSAASLLAGYVKSWGGPSAAALSAWAFVELAEGDARLAYSLPFAALAAIAAVIGSWLWLGTKKSRRSTAALALGLPLALMIGAYGYGFFRRTAIVVEPGRIVIYDLEKRQRVIELKRKVGGGEWESNPSNASQRPVNLR